MPERRTSNRDSMYSSAQSNDGTSDSDENDDGDDEVFHSARTSVDKEDYSKGEHPQLLQSWISPVIQFKK